MQKSQKIRIYSCLSAELRLVEDMCIEDSRRRSAIQTAAATATRKSAVNPPVCTATNSQLMQVQEEGGANGWDNPSGRTLERRRRRGIGFGERESARANGGDDVGAADWAAAARVDPSVLAPLMPPARSPAPPTPKHREWGTCGSGEPQAAPP